MLERLKKALAERGLSGHGVATHLHIVTGFGISSISRMLNGKQKLGPGFLRAVCHAFDINEEWVRTGDGPMLATPNGLPKQAIGRMTRGYDYSEAADAMRSVSEFIVAESDHLNLCRIIFESMKKMTDRELTDVLAYCQDLLAKREAKP